MNHKGKFNKLYGIHRYSRTSERSRSSRSSSMSSSFVISRVLSLFFSFRRRCRYQAPGKIHRYHHTPYPFCHKEEALSNSVFAASVGCNRRRSDAMTDSQSSSSTASATRLQQCDAKVCRVVLRYVCIYHTCGMLSHRIVHNVSRDTSG